MNVPIDVVVSALTQLGGRADARLLCAKLTCPCCGFDYPEGAAQLAMQRATDLGVLKVAENWDLVLS